MSNSIPQIPSLSLSSPTLSPSSSQFSHSLIKIAVTQILKSIGFKSSKSSALETLTRITTLFLQFLSKSASSHANFTCHRTHCNIFDIIHAIEHSSLAFGFNGASNIHQPLLKSKVVDDLHFFFDEFDDFPFSSRNLRNFRSSSSLNSNSSVIFSGKSGSNWNDGRGFEIPRWLPRFPEVGKIEGVKVEGEKSLWEERMAECRPTKAAKIKKGRKEIVFQGRRERVKFRLGKRKRNENVGCLDDFELRNGVCRGGKRVGLIKKTDSCSDVFDDDEDEKEMFSNEL